MDPPAASNDWIPIALGPNVPAGTAAPVTVAATEIALWRGASGAVHAWRDRCPHRGMRLSFGFVRGDDLVCLYHGWRYRSDGGCRSIPAHPDLEPPKSICADVYPCIEKGGLVWMRLRDAGEPEQDPPDIDGGAIPVRSLTVGASLYLVRKCLAGAGGSPTAAGPRGPAAEPAEIAPNLFALTRPTAEPDRETLIAAVQPVSGTRTTLHLLVVASEALDRRALQLRISRWGESFRRACEALQDNTGSGLNDEDNR